MNTETFTSQQIIARKLLQMKSFCVQTNNPFKWSNGWQSPIYFDDRRILSNQVARNFIWLELAHQIALTFPEREVIAGVAVNAIVHSAIVAEQLGLPLVYVYPKPKDHGLENQIEGEVSPKQKIIVIENQITTGVHAMKVVEALRNNGCHVQGIVTIFDYKMPMAAKRFLEADVPVYSLTDFQTVMEEAGKLEAISSKDINILQDWHKNPIKWSKSN